MKRLFSDRWHSTRLASLFDENTQLNEEFSESHALQFKYGSIVPKKQYELTNDLITTYKKYTIVRPGDIMVNGLNLNYDFVTQRVALVPCNGIITSAYISLRPHQNVSVEFYTYYFKTLDSIKLFNGMGTGIRLTLSYEILKNLVLPLPPRTEQDQIVRYLDWQVSKINRLIAAKRKEVALMRDNLKSAVAYYTTHGLGNHELCQSEIYWLTHYPNDWRVTKLRYILEKHRREVTPNAELLICSNSGEVVKRGDGKLGLVASSDDIYQGVTAGDLLIHGMDTWHGAIAISSFDGMCTPVVHVCTCKEEKRYVAYYLKMMAYTKVFKAISNGVRQNTSDFRSWDKVGDLLICLPTHDEQVAIADKLDYLTVQTKAGISFFEKQIEHLQELRTRLISDVVTGQVDVRGIKVPDVEYTYTETREEELEETEEN